MKPAPPTRPAHSPLARFRSGFVTILGSPNAGKSTLFNALIGSKLAIVTDKPQTTRNAIQGVLTVTKPVNPSRAREQADTTAAATGNDSRKRASDAPQQPIAQVIFLDTPGIQQPQSRLDEQMMEEVHNSLSGRDLLLLVADASRSFGASDRAAIELAKQTRVPCILLLNKVDLVAKQKLLPRIDQYRQLHDFAEIIPISALKGINLDVVRDKIVANLPEGPLYFPSDYLTEQPMRFLAGEIVREKIIRATHQELPYASAVVVEQFEEKPNLIRIIATIFVEREGQKGIIIGTGGEMLKRVGTSARQELESILGSKVYLELHVKVSKNWREDPRFLGALDWRRMAGE